jgi:hypothetical protein
MLIYILIRNNTNIALQVVVRIVAGLYSPDAISDLGLNTGYPEWLVVFLSLSRQIKCSNLPL